ncbi:hypothetical protein HOK021_13870 [Streptomyces hygroscopicus]|nr:hypothetical protein HOK021_13870 [Streptomyces hygroscopicus]
MWHTPHAWIFTTASPGPGSGTRMVSSRTGSFFPGAITPRTSCAIGTAPLTDHLRDHCGAPPPIRASPYACRATTHRTTAGSVIFAPWPPAARPLLVPAAADQRDADRRQDAHHRQSDQPAAGRAGGVLADPEGRRRDEPAEVPQGVDEGRGGPPPGVTSGEGRG